MDGRAESRRGRGEGSGRAAGAGRAGQVRPQDVPPGGLGHPGAAQPQVNEGKGPLGVPPPCSVGKRSSAVSFVSFLRPLVKS